MKVLLAYSLVQANADLGSYCMHAVVHDWSLGYLNKNDTVRREFSSLALICLGSTIPIGPLPDYQSRHQRLLPHANENRKFIRGVLLDVDGLSVDDNTTRSESLCRAFKNIAVLYKDQDRLDESIAIALQAIDLFEPRLGPEHMLVLGLFNNLGIVYSSQGKFEEARDLLKKALAGYQKLFGIAHPAGFRRNIQSWGRKHGPRRIRSGGSTVPRYFEGKGGAPGS